jgi:hypothetical protein
MTGATSIDAAEAGRQTPATTAAWLFARLPDWVIDTLSAEQKVALAKAAEDSAWGRHPVNIRLSLPLIARRYYLPIVAGEEKRSEERRSHERHRYPLRTAANLFFFLGLAALIYVAALFVLAVQVSIIEF